MDPVSSRRTQKNKTNKQLLHHEIENRYNNTGSTRQPRPCGYFGQCGFGNQSRHQQHRLVAADFGATMEHVALLQLFRLISVIIIFPPMIRKMLPPSERVLAPKKIQTSEREEKPNKQSGLSYLVSIATAFAGGVSFVMLGVPAGAILGSIFAIALLNLATDGAAYPAPLKPMVQIFAGCYIGSKVTFQTLAEGNVLLLPALILLAELFVMAFLTAFVQGLSPQLGHSHLLCNTWGHHRDGAHQR
jgi:uncharacterized membrane protein AbrB (regulator of aidB expression)